MGKNRKFLYGIALYLFVQGCVHTRHEIDVAPVEIKPIHITIDVNVKVDKSLNDFFGDLDKLENKTGTGTANNK